MSVVVIEKEIGTDVRRFNTAPPNFDLETDLPKGFMQFVLPLHRKLTPRQQSFIRKRAEVLAASPQGQKPNYLPQSEATTPKSWPLGLHGQSDPLQLLRHWVDLAGSKHDSAQRAVFSESA